MKRKCLAVGIILLFVGTSIIPVIAQNTEKSLTSSRGTWLYVGGSGPGNYTSIQDAIENASDGDTVFVYDDSSPYKEQISIQKQLHLLGENKETTIIDSPNCEVAVYISTAASVCVEGFTINISNVVIGIQLYHSHNCSLLNNILSAATSSILKGIVLTNSHNIRVYNNTIKRSDALIAKNCDNITILQNTMINVTSGIELSNCTNSVISFNILKRSAIAAMDRGISLRLCRTCTISFNNFIDTFPYAAWFEQLPGAQNRWWRNYWQQPRILPKPIFGRLTNGAYIATRIFWIHFDFFPAKQPYNISGVY